MAKAEAATCGPPAGRGVSRAAATLDSLGMWEATAALPSSCRGARAAARTLLEGRPAGRRSPSMPVPSLGLGTRCHGRRAAAAVGRPSWPVPVTVGSVPRVAGLRRPRHPGDRRPFSGDTAETLEAAPSAAGAQAPRGGRRRATPRAALAAAGRRRAGVPWCPVGSARPRRRAPARRGHRAAGGRAGPSATWALGATPAVPAAAAALARRRDGSGSDGPPAELARRIGRTFPLVHGSPAPPPWPRGGGRPQVNENAKAPAFCALAIRLCSQRAGRVGPGRRRHPPGA